MREYKSQPRGLVARVSEIIMRSRVRFPALPWEFSLKGRIPAVTMVWVGQQNLGLRALLALHLPLSPLTSSGQRNCASWVSQPQKSVTLLPCPGGRTTKSKRTCGGTGQKKKNKNGISPITATDRHIKLSPDIKRTIFEFQGRRWDFGLVLLMMLRQERRLRVLEHRVLREILGTRRDKVTGEWRRLNYEERNDSYSITNIMWVIKPSRMR